MYITYIKIYNFVSFGNLYIISLEDSFNSMERINQNFTNANKPWRSHNFICEEPFTKYI